MLAVSASERTRRSKLARQAARSVRLDDGTDVARTPHEKV